MAEYERFAWFSRWVHQYLGISMTFVRGLDESEMLAAFGTGVEAAKCQTFLESVKDPDTRWVRVGRLGAWAFAQEHFTSIGGDPQTLQRLSQDGGEALSLTYTQTINTFLYARDAKLVSGFDLTVPSIRYGLDEHHFDTVIANAGFNADQPPEPAAGALFIHDLFGIDLDQQMLEGPALSAKLRE